MKSKQCLIYDTDAAVVRAVTDMLILFDIEGQSVVSATEVLEPLSPDCASLRNECLRRDGQTLVSTTLCYQDRQSRHHVVTEEHTIMCEKTEEETRRLVLRQIRRNTLRLLEQMTETHPSQWGILRGVRPTKVVHRLLEQGWEQDEIVTHLQQEYLMQVEKAQLLTEVALHQRHFLPDKQNTSAVSIYIGIPYCPSRCLYCSFPGFVLPKKTEVQKFMYAIAEDIKAAAVFVAEYGLKVDSVYIGGGTPTSLDEDDFEQLLNLASRYLIQAETREFTVEAGRPDSLTLRKISAISEHRVTRVSVNPQTMQQKTLKHIGRMHTVRDIIEIFHAMRQASVPTINMDVIVGLPGEALTDFADTMQQIGQLQPDNLTVHTLAIKRGSLLKQSIAEYALPDAATTAAMLDLANDRARAWGMQPYYLYRQKHMTGNLENIGFAKPGHECLYNVLMMEERQPIIGIGPGAATKAVQVADGSLQQCYHPKDVKTYIERLPEYVKAREALLHTLFTQHKGE